MATRREALRAFEEAIEAAAGGGLAQGEMAMLVNGYFARVQKNIRTTSMKKLSPYSGTPTKKPMFGRGLPPTKKALAKKSTPKAEGTSAEAPAKEARRSPQGFGPGPGRRNAE